MTKEFGMVEGEGVYTDRTATYYSVQWVHSEKKI